LLTEWLQEGWMLGKEQKNVRYFCPTTEF
jgi:hypothetical protein